MHEVPLACSVSWATKYPTSYKDTTKNQEDIHEKSDSNVVYIPSDPTRRYKTK